MTEKGKRPRNAVSLEWREYEIEAIPGMEEFVEDELAGLGPHVKADGRSRAGRVAVRYSGDPWILNGLRSAVAVHLVQDFAVPRPKALLGHEHLTRLIELLWAVIGLHPPGSFRALKLSAAGAESGVFRRLREELSGALCLTDADPSEQGDLLVGVRRPPDASLGWQVLVRLTPRPLSARAWRVCNMPGALNATIAHAMIRLTEPSPRQRFLNVACGSGTLLIERLELCPAPLALGVEVSAQALDCARANLQASQHLDAVQLLQSDAARLPIASGSVDAIAADLPYGMLVGEEEDVRSLYAAVVEEAARVAAEFAPFIVITARGKWLRAAVERYREYWETTRVVSVRVPFRSGYFDAHIFVLRRGGGRGLSTAGTRESSLGSSG